MYSASAVIIFVYCFNITEVEFGLLQYNTVKALRTAVAFQKAGGLTNTQQALELLTTQVFNVTMGDRTGVNNTAVVITDGKSNVARGKLYGLL